MRIRVITDSTCDLPPEYIAAHNIVVLPLRVNLGDRDYADDGVEITPDAIFQAVAQGSDLPKTAAVNADACRAAFLEALKTCDAVIHLTISAEFSSCHANALIAAEGLPVYCVDTRSLCSGIGLVVCEAVERAEAGEAPEAIAEACRAMVDRVDTSFILNRLDYLYKGGRCSMVAMLGANALKLKPCIEVSEGRMIVGRKYRGMFARCAMQYMADRLRSLDAIDDRRVFLVHTAVDPALIAAMRDRLRAMNYFKEIIEVRAGSTISCHCGEETLGLMYLRK